MICFSLSHLLATGAEPFEPAKARADHRRRRHRKTDEPAVTRRPSVQPPARSIAKPRFIAEFRSGARRMYFGATMCWSSHAGFMARCSANQMRASASVRRTMRLLIAVGVGIVGMQVAGATLFLFIGVSRFRMGAQIIPESEMAHDVRRIRSEDVKLGDPYAALIGQGTITPFCYSSSPCQTYPNASKSERFRSRSSKSVTRASDR